MKVARGSTIKDDTAHVSFSSMKGSSRIQEGPRAPDNMYIVGPEQGEG